MHCPDCGSWQPDRNDTCANCGRELGEELLEFNDANSSSDTPTAVPGATVGESPQLVLPSSWTRPEGVPEIVPLTSEETRIGRGSDLDALRRDEYLSPVHAVFYRRGDAVWVRDVSKYNGVFLRVDGESHVFDGSWIRVGRQVLRFRRIDRHQIDEEVGERFASSPNPGYWGRIDVMVGPYTHGDSYAVAGDRFRIGAQEGDVHFEDQYLSGIHAEIERVGDGQLIRDLDSENGTFVSIRGERKVEDGDELLIGGNVFRLEF